MLSKHQKATLSDLLIQYNCLTSPENNRNDYVTVDIASNNASDTTVEHQD